MAADLRLVAASALETWSGRPVPVSARGFRVDLPGPRPRSVEVVTTAEEWAEYCDFQWGDPEAAAAHLVGWVRRLAPGTAYLNYHLYDLYESPTPPHRYRPGSQSRA